MTNLTTWGISEGYFDVYGNWRVSDPAAIDEVAKAMGASEVGPPPPAVVTVRLDHQLPTVEPGHLVLEDGTELSIEGNLPPDLTAGYHWMRPIAGEPYQLIVSPGLAPLPDGREWGFSAQLYATRSRRSWGMGDLADLGALGGWSSGLGASLALVNPLHACAPTLPQQPSPYYAGSRCFSNPIYIAVEDVPGARETPRFEQFVATGTALNSEPLVDRDRVWAIKSEALEAIFARFQGDPSFDRFRQERGVALDRFAAYCALAEIHGPAWPAWPAQYRQPNLEGIEQFVRSPAGRKRVEYYAWLQWVLDRQLSNASQKIGLVQDLAVGVDPQGPDAWIWQDCFATGMRVGAPPDEFNTQGQDWGLHPFDPWRLRSAGYAPWIEALRNGLRFGRGLRVDHVMGLFRLFWIPDTRPPAQGVYVRYPHHDLLNILALEAQRRGAFIVGEDLGTVEDEVRRDLSERRIMSYRVWWFEDQPCEQWPAVAMASMTTHDLPTVAGVIDGSDLAAQRDLGLHPNEQASEQLRQKLLERTGSDSTTSVEQVIERVHRDLGRAGCLVVTATLDDGLAVTERPNMPGTVDQWPNWCLALPQPLDEFPNIPLFDRIADGLARRS